MVPRNSMSGIALRREDATYYRCRNTVLSAWFAHEEKHPLQS